jgi:hypothetical protein
LKRHKLKFRADFAKQTVDGVDYMGVTRVPSDEPTAPNSVPQATQEELKAFDMLHDFISPPFRLGIRSPHRKLILRVYMVRHSKVDQKLSGHGDTSQAMEEHHKVEFSDLI